MRRADVIIDAGCGELTAAIGAALARYVPLVADVRALSRGSGLAAIADAKLIVVGLRDASLAPSTILIEYIRERMPHVGIFVCAFDHTPVGPHMKLLADAGVDAILAVSTGSDVRALADAAHARVAIPAPEYEIRVLADAWPASTGRTLALFCLRNGYRTACDDCLAMWYAVHPRTIHNWLEDAEYPSVAVLERCSVQLNVSELSRRHRGTIEQIARELGQADGAALARARKMLRAHLMGVGERATILRKLLPGDA